MGIRFDRDSRRATNGPMIFFSDPSAEISLSEEIRGAIEARLSFYAYRMPGDLMVSFGSSDGCEEGIGTPGFVVAPFLPDTSYITIPYKFSRQREFNTTGGCLFPEKSTTRQEHTHAIESIKRVLSQQSGADTRTAGKIVAARVIVENGRVDIGATFGEMCRRYPDAFVFCHSTPFTGCWIGASPELLLKSGHPAVENGRSLSTMALAGTRPAGSEREWDSKNIEEQEMVTAYIADIFRKNGVIPSVGATFTKKAGTVEHICTPISGTANLPLSPQILSHLLKELSPTPALCGTPRPLALDMIGRTENFRRGCYGGFCGPFHSVSDFSFYATLRCSLVEQQRYCLFVGGGITLRSDPEEEWEETEIKSSTIRNALRLE